VNIYKFHYSCTHLLVVEALSLQYATPSNNQGPHEAYRCCVSSADTAEAAEAAEAAKAAEAAEAAEADTAAEDANAAAEDANAAG